METCEKHTVDKEKMSTIVENLEEHKNILEASEFLKAFSDSSRLKILLSMLNGGLCVCEICEAVRQSQPAVSHHLRSLRTQRIVDFKKEGRKTVYYLDDVHIEDIIRTTFNHIKEKG